MELPVVTLIKSMCVCVHFMFQHLQTGSCTAKVCKFSDQKNIQNTHSLFNRDAYALQVKAHPHTHIILVICVILRLSRSLNDKQKLKKQLFLLASFELISILFTLLDGNSFTHKHTCIWRMLKIVKK